MKKTVAAQPVLKQSPTKQLLHRIWEHRLLYVLAIPLFLYFLVFAYGPMYGLLLAFKDFNYSAGIIGSPWADHYGMEHFITLFSNSEFLNAFKNTFVISFGRLIFEFPIPIILALLLNEVRSTRYKRVVQTVFTFPHFISWIIVVGLLFNLFSYDGIINQLLVAFGMKRTTVLSNPATFKGLIFATSNWKEAGYGTIIYLAAITGINSELYEAGRIDGANRWQLVKSITWPCIKPTVATMLLLTVASMMSAGFDQIFNMSNAAVQDSIDIIDTLVYRMQFVKGADFGFTTAIGLFKSVINLALMLVANTIVKRMTGKGIY